MTSAEKYRILIVGDVESNFDAVFDKVRSLNKKSPFNCLLCVGSFFSDSISSLEAIEPYRTGAKTVAIPTYFLGPNTQKQTEIFEKLGIDDANNEVCPNLQNLGRKGVYTLAAGFTLAYLSGTSVKENEEKGAWQFDKKDIISLKNSCVKNFSAMDDYKGVDFLLTSQWPEGITDDPVNTSKLLSYLTLEVRPRYHFCGLNSRHFEKPPFRIPAFSSRSIEPASRFIALAKVNNAEKSKFLYALNVQPLSTMRLTDLMMKSTDEVECPYMSLDFNDIVIKSSDSGQFFWNMNDGSNNDGRRRYEPQRKRFKPMTDLEKCWFCLSSGDVEKHLIICIGNDVYMALAKGPVNNHHVLILPTDHIQASSQLTEENFQTMTIFKKSLKKFFDSKNMATVFFERNYKSSHCAVNAIPVPKDVEWQLSATLKDKAEEYNLNFETIPKLTSPKDLPMGPYFVIELPDETLITRDMKGFPINFGRDVVCAETVLNAEDKVDWKSCSLSKGMEVDLVRMFREEYKPFDFTLDDDDDNGNDDE